MDLQRALLGVLFVTVEASAPKRPRDQPQTQKKPAEKAGFGEVGIVGVRPGESEPGDTKALRCREQGRDAKRVVALLADEQPAWGSVSRHMGGAGDRHAGNRLV